MPNFKFTIAMLKIIYTTKFLRDAKKLKKKFYKIAHDIKDAEDQIKNNKDKSALIQGMSGLKVFKMRQKNSSIDNGKSGGFRIIYQKILQENVVVMLTIYSKNSQESFSKDEIIGIITEYE